MDIPSLSVALSQANVLNQAGTAVLSMALDSTSQETASLLEMMDVSATTTKMMEQSVHPNLGANIDISI